MLLNRVGESCGTRLFALISGITAGYRRSPAGHEETSVGVVEVERGIGRGSGHKAVVEVDLREVLAGEAVLGSELR